MISKRHVSALAPTISAISLSGRPSSLSATTLVRLSVRRTAVLPDFAIGKLQNPPCQFIVNNLIVYFSMMGWLLNKEQASPDGGWLRWRELMTEGLGGVSNQVRLRIPFRALDPFWRKGFHPLP
jgi:hypothetical protein